MTTLAEPIAPKVAFTDDWEREFAERVRESEARVIAIALSVLRNRDDAEEVAQEAFLRAYRRYQSLRAPEKFRAWIHRIVFRLALNHRRSRLRRLKRDTLWHDSLQQPSPHSSAPVVDRMMLEEVRAAIESLPEKLRVVLLLCAVKDMDRSEVAAILRVPEGTVRSRLHLARKRLHQRLG